MKSIIPTTVSIEQLLAFIDKTLLHKYWKLTATAIILATTFIFTSPFFNFNYFDTSSWTLIEQQATDLLTPVYASEESHDAKKIFRLTVPFISSLLGINRVGIITLQMLLGVLIIYLLIDLIFKLTAKRTIAFCVGMLAASSYFCYSAFYDVFGRVDAFGYFFLILALWFRNPVAIGLSLFLGCFCDERVLVNSSFVFIFWLMASPKNDNPERLSFSKIHIAIIIAWGLYFLCRYILISNYGFHTASGGVGLDIMLQSRHYIPIAVFSTYGLLWIVILAAFGVLIMRRNWLLLSLLGVSIIISLTVSLLVQDINRSLAYSFPLLIIAICVLNKYIKYNTLYKNLVLLFAISCIVPIYNYDSKIHYQPNILIRLVEVLKNK